MSNNTLLTGSIREQYIAMRFKNNEPSNVDVNKLSDSFMKEQLDYDTWYESKTLEYQLFIDTIAERTNFIIDEADYDAFIEELANYGINDASQFEDAFSQESEGYGERVFSEFSEELIESCGYTIEPEFIANCIDWELVWYSSLRYDYQTIEFKGNTYFFHNI
jgi:hypothetical protein